MGTANGAVLFGFMRSFAVCALVGGCTKYGVIASPVVSFGGIKK